MFSNTVETKIRLCARIYIPPPWGLGREKRGEREEQFEIPTLQKQPHRFLLRLSQLIVNLFKSCDFEFILPFPTHPVSHFTLSLTSAILDSLNLIFLLKKKWRTPMPMPRLPPTPPKKNKTLRQINPMEETPPPIAARELPLRTSVKSTRILPLPVLSKSRSFFLQHLVLFYYRLHFFLL